MHGSTQSQYQEATFAWRIYVVADSIWLVLLLGQIFKEEACI